MFTEAMDKANRRLVVANSTLMAKRRTAKTAIPCRNLANYAEMVASIAASLHRGEPEYFGATHAEALFNVAAALAESGTQGVK